MQNQDVMVVSVTLDDRDDGGLRVYSADLPGLILSGSDKARVFSDIGPAIQAIFHHQGMDVTVRSARPLSEVMKAEGSRNVDMHVQQFVVEMKLAAAALAAIGVRDSEANLRNKISRGGFTGAFLTQCLTAMGVTALRLND